jgi:Protein of unknown function (DUF2934)
MNFPTPTLSPVSATPPSEEQIRDYANYLYLQHGSQDGHDGSDWLEAEACLRAGIPKGSSRTRLHHHVQLTERTRLSLIKHGSS